MRATRGLILGFAIGALIGLLVYLRLQRQREALSSVGQPQELVLEVEEPEVPTRQTKPVTTRSRPRGTQVDDLPKIHGIGPVYARRLNDAGVRSFTELAALTPAQLQAIIGARVGGGDFETWIQQARQLAETGGN